MLQITFSKNELQTVKQFDDLCELAHNKTVAYCKEHNKVVNCPHCSCEADECTACDGKGYSAFAQDVFDEYQEELIQLTNI